MKFRKELAISTKARKTIEKGRNQEKLHWEEERKALTQRISVGDQELIEIREQLSNFYRTTFIK
jgi:hypothetical protein